LKDNAYGLIKFYQLQGHNRLAHNEVQFGSVDFVALANANGCTASRITRNDELEPALARAIASGAPALLEVPICYEEALQLLTIGGISEPEPERKPFTVPPPSVQSNFIHKIRGTVTIAKGPRP
jgi:thiamine pyrophosphate-dependent acetolactate synthase large subunit-like protein